MKKKLFCALSLVTALGLHADNASWDTPLQACLMDPDFYRGDDSLPKASPCAPTYNPPANVSLADGFGGFLRASYLYWYAGEDGLDMASLNGYSAELGTVTLPTSRGKIFYPDFRYQSGFKIGLGFNQLPDDWVASLDYTYVRSNARSSFSEDLPEVLYFTSWFSQASPTGQAVAAESFSSHWHLGVDWLDAALSRPFYQGRKLIINGFGGLRASWIRQSLTINADELVNVTPDSGEIQSKNYSRSWGIGPRAGLSTEWLLGCGFRMQGSLGGSLLFTQYTTIAHKETTAGTVGTGYFPVSYATHNYNCLRPMSEMGVGLAWGTYFLKQRLHLNLGADYDFNYLWSQNVMRVLNDQQISGVGGSAGDLYLHGLTVNARFDF